MKHPTLSRRQELALRFLAAREIWQTAEAIDAVLKMHGEDCDVQTEMTGVVLCGLAEIDVADGVFAEYKITFAGRELAATLPKLEVKS